MNITEFYRCRDQILPVVAAVPSLSARLLGADAIAHVGDSFFHDVCGAAAAKIPVVFVAGGIEHQERQPHRRFIPGWSKWLKTSRNTILAPKVVNMLKFLMAVDHDIKSVDAIVGL